MIRAEKVRHHGNTASKHAVFWVYDCKRNGAGWVGKLDSRMTSLVKIYIRDDHARRRGG